MREISCQLRVRQAHRRPDVGFQWILRLIWLVASGSLASASCPPTLCPFVALSLHAPVTACQCESSSATIPTRISNLLVRGHCRAAAGRLNFVLVFEIVMWPVARPESAAHATSPPQHATVFGELLSRWRLPAFFLSVFLGGVSLIFSPGRVGQGGIGDGRDRGDVVFAGFFDRRGRTYCCCRCPDDHAMRKDVFEMGQLRTRGFSNRG